MMTLRSIIFTFLLTATISIFMTASASAQGVRITSFSEIGSLNGETLYSASNYMLELRAVPPTNNQGGTWQWAIGGSFQFISGTTTSRNIQIQWATAGATYPVQVTYTGPNGTSSAMLNVTVTTAEQRIHLTNVPCSQEGTLVSGTAVIPTTIMIENTTNTTIKSYWINYSGQRSNEQIYPPGAAYGWFTWVGHPWIMTDENGNCLSIHQSIREAGRITVANVSKIEFEKILSDSEPLSLNPNAEGGRRFYPDKKDPDELASRNQVRVKATVSRYVPNQKVYFRSFDVDDPSANTLPIDDDSGANVNAEDNRGMVGNSKAGQLDLPASSGCTLDSATNLWGCSVDANGTAVINFTTTMNPGDNFAIAASLNNANYLSGITVNGINLKDASQVTLPIPPEPNPSTPYALLRGTRSEMLTVWRKIHIEVDRMENVGDSNKTIGTITATTLIPNPNCNPAPPPTPPPSPPCYPSFRRLDLNTTLLDIGRFSNGRIVIGLRTFNVEVNSANALLLKGVPPQSGKIRIGDTFILYDDDDYNADDNLVDGDYNEPIMELPESLKYISNEDGVNTDGLPKNVYASAYIMPEYDWAFMKNYNQTNLGFLLNVSEANVSSIISVNRNSGVHERDDFWIAYILIAYQGETNEDADGEVKGNTGIGPPVISGDYCDCYQTTTCQGTTCSTIPRGVSGNLIYQEVMQDLTKSFLRNAIAIKLKGTTVPHEIGHQFGLNGDNRDPANPNLTRPSVYKIMDYPDYAIQTDDYYFHPEHVNILRWRVKSPGQ